MEKDGETKIRPEVVLDEERGVEFAHSHIIIHCNEGHIDINHHFQQ